MHRSYDSHSSSYSIDEYLERINRITRMPSMVADYPHFPNVHEVLNNKPTYVEEHDDHQKKMSHKNHQKRHQSPEVGRDGKGDVVEEKTIDVEADGFTQQKHKSFELCKWDTFKVY